MTETHTGVDALARARLDALEARVAEMERAHLQARKDLESLLLIVTAIVDEMPEQGE